MGSEFTFSQKLAGALGAVVALAIAVAAIASFALRGVTERKDRR